MAYYVRTRTAFPDQRHENVRLHFADDAVIAEFDLLGTNLGEFYGLPQWAQHIGNLLPVTHFLRIVRGALLKQQTLPDMGPNLLALALFVLIIAGLALARSRTTLD